MATITFQDGTGLAFNPGIEEVLIPTGAITQTLATLFEITNNSGGPFNGFKFQLTSDGIGGNAFTYTGTTPNGGNINGIKVFAPDGTTLIIDVPAGGFGNVSLVTFFNNLTDPSAPSPLAAVFDALDNLLDGSNVINGSTLADHLTAFGNDTSNTNQLFGGDGDDVLWSRGIANDTKLVGGAGNDVIRVGDDNDYELVAGANEDGSGGAGEINTLEIWGTSENSVDAQFAVITNINALRFVDGAPPPFPVVDGADLDVDFQVDQIGVGLVSLTLAVDGSTTASPFSFNRIDIETPNDPSNTTPVILDLSGWTFTNWNQDRSSIDIDTNSAVAVNDQITGTMVADTISTDAGDDIIRGFGGADRLFGGDGSDTFIYGLNEAVFGEQVIGGFEGGDTGIDQIRVDADNDFTGVFFESIEQLVFNGAATATFSQDFINNSSEQSGGGGQVLAVALIPTATVVGDGNANTLAFVLQNLGNVASGIDLSAVVFQSWTDGVDEITIDGTNSFDAIAGSSQADIIDGQGGSDSLKGNGGDDAFRFSTAFGQGVDHIADFTRKEDIIELDKDIFSELKKGELKKKFFTFDTKAKDKNDHVLYDKEDGVLRYDDDGKGGHKAHIVAILDDAASLKAGDIFVI